MKSLTGILAETRSWIYQNRRAIGAIAVALIPVAAYFTLLGLYAVNIPYNDDYDTILDFLNQFRSSSDFLARINLTLAFWNDHRIVFSKLITLLFFGIQGQANFFAMIIFGNAALLLMTLSIYRVFRMERGIKPVYFLPAIFLLFQPSFNENAYMAMAALANFYVIAFGFLSLLFLSELPARPMRNLPSFALAILFAVLSYFTQNNGILFLGIGLVYLLYSRRWVASTVWAAISAGAFLFYRHYGGVNITAIPLSFNPGSIFSGITYYFAFVGNSFGVSVDGYLASRTGLSGFFLYAIPIAAGIIFSLYFSFLTLTKYFRKNPALYSLFLFLFITAVGAALARGQHYGIAQALTSRYRIVTIFFPILIYLSLMEITTNPSMQKIVFKIGLSLAIFFSVTTYVIKIRPIQIHRGNLIQSMRKWVESGKGIEPLGHPYGYANTILTESVRNRTYTPPPETGWTNR